MQNEAELFCPHHRGQFIGCRHSVTCFVLTILIFSLGCGGSRAPTAPTQQIPAATLLYPAKMGDEVDPFKPFSWKPVNSATGYYLKVGTAPGLEDVFGIGELPPNITSWPVDNLLPGTYYARLFTDNAGTWGYQDLWFTTAAQSQPSDPPSFYSTVNQLTASVRWSDPDDGVPTPGEPLADEVALRGKATADCTDFAFTLVELLQQQHIYARPVTLTLNGTGWDGHTVVEYYDPFWKKWSVADPTFGVVYFDNVIQRGQSAQELSAAVFSESWSLIQPQFVTPNGDSYMRNYYLDPITMYLNVVPQGGTLAKSVVHDPIQFLLPFLYSSANPHGFYLFEFGNSSESLDIQNQPGPYTPQSGLITLTPQQSTLWSKTHTLNDGWVIGSAPADVQAFTFRRPMF